MARQANLPIEIRTLGDIGSKGGLLDHQHQLVTLLAYLVHEGPTDRQTVARLFWPRAEKPLNSLSSALTRIRQLVPGVLVAERHRLSVTCSTDAYMVIEASASGDVATVRSAYLGAFLSGFQIKQIGIELEEWIFDTRDAVEGVAIAALAVGASNAARAGKMGVATDLAEHACAIASDTPILIEVIDDLYPSLVKDGPSAVRLRSYALEAGIALPEVMSVPQTASRAELRPDNGLWGRAADLDDLVAALAPGRVVNLFGIGGVGKTQVARSLALGAAIGDSYPVVHIIERAAEQDGQNLLNAVANVLDDAEQAVEGSDRRTLVIIDDVAATTATSAALESLANNDTVCIVALSRLRMDSPRITSVPLRGLTAVNADGGAGPAVAMFRERVGPQVIDRIGEATFTKHAIAICSQVSGLPLALELIAAWLRLVTIDEALVLLDDDEILDELPPGQDVSLSRIIEQSWELLNNSAQNALGDLSVMNGSFDRESARHVASVGIRQLSDLHDHSMLESSADGRLRCHPLVQTFARRQLATTGRLAEVHDNHSRWFLQRLNERADDLTGPAAGKRLGELSDDQGNILAAWRAAVAGKEWGLVLESLPGLDRFLLRSGQTLVAHHLFNDGIQALIRSSDVDTNRPLAAALANNLAWVDMLLGRTDEAARHCAWGVDQLLPDDVETHIALLRTQGALYGNESDAKSSLAGYIKARELAEQLNDPALQALLDEDIGRAHEMLGEHGKAITAFRRTLDAARGLGDPHMEARSYLMIGVATTPTDPDHSLVLFDEGEALAATQDLTQLAAYFPRDRAETFLVTGDIDRSISEFTRGMELAESVGNFVLLTACQLGIARAYFRQGDAAHSKEHLQIGLRSAIRSKLWPQPLAFAIELSRRCIDADPSNALAHRLHSFAATHRKTPFNDRKEFALADLTDPGSGMRLDELCELTMQVFQALHR